jgi:glycerol-1-phosphate dehydrogenase [NAD(P)+]
MSTQVLLEYLQTERPGKRVWAAGTPDMLAQFREAGIDPESSDPEITVLGFDTTLDYSKLQTLHEAIQNGAEFLAVNCDYVCPVPGGSIPDCGAMAALFASIHGFMPETFGKPTRRALDFILRRTGRAEQEVCFVGDRLYTDVAIAAGSKAASVLVLSGEAKLEDLENCPDACPDIIAADLGELAELLSVEQ